jgi:lipopolysaccharide assembly outer membrane protein LptD (OstA)
LHIKLIKIFFKSFLFLILFLTIWIVEANALSYGIFSFQKDTVLLKDASTIDTTDIKNDTTLNDDTTKTVSDTTKTSEKKDKDFLDAEVNYTAKDSIVLSRDENKIFLYKDAKVTYKNIELKADYIEFIQDSNTVYARGMKDSAGNMVGQPIFKEGSKIYDARFIRYNFKTKKGFIRKVVTEEEQGYLHSRVTKKHTGDQIHFKKGKYTTCDKTHPHFYIAISKGKVIPGEKIIAGPSYFVVGDIPLPIGIPFGYFPVQKKQSSGIIIPSYGEEQNRGFFLRNGGYYFGISDKMDLQLTGEVYSKGTWGAHMVYRYRKRYKFSSNLSADFKKLVLGDRGAPDYRVSRDYSIKWSHSQSAKANPNSSFNANVNISSSSYDKNHSRDMQNYTTNTKTSSISYRKTWPSSPFSFNAKLRHSQNSKTRQVNLTLPTMSFNMNRIYPFRPQNKTSGEMKWYENIQLSYNADLENRIKTKDSLLFTQTQFKDFESGFRHRVPISLNFKTLKYFNITPRVNYQGVLFPRYIEKYWNNTDSVVVTDTVEKFRYAHSIEPSIGFGFSPKIYGIFQFKNEDSKVQAVRHVLSPSVSFSYRPDVGYMTDKYYDEYTDEATGRSYEYSYFDNQLYSPPSAPRQSGNVNFNLGNNIEMKVRTPQDSADNVKKVTLLNDLSFSSSYNLFADSLNWSPISIRGRTSLFKNKVNLSFSGTVNPYAINENGNIVNNSEWGKSGSIGRLTNARVSLDMNWESSKGKTDESSDNNGSSGMSRNPYYDYFDVPWSFRFGYSFNYSKRAFKSNITQSLRLSGNFSLTDKWKFDVSANYDIQEDKLVATSIGITRDLHCWTMSFDWIPVGYRKSYFFEIRVNASILQDLKYKKQQSWYDTQDY